MKDNLNIEQLFKEKFNAFEADVNPSAWANIQQGINVTSVAGSSAASVGMSGFVKALIISGGIVAATIGGIYFFANDEANKAEEASTNPLVNTPIIVPEVLEAESQHATVDGAEENLGSNQATQSTLSNGLEQTGTVNGSTNVGNTASQTSVNPVDVTTTNDEPDDEIVGTVGDSKEDTGDNGVDPQQQAHKATGTISFDPGNEFAPSTYQFHANASNFKTVTWEFENGDVLQGADVSYTFGKPGKYSVKMTVNGETNAVEDVVEIEIKSTSSIDLVPNIISPNGDRKNDFFVIRMTDIETFSITIRDKNGQVVFQSTDPDFKWYGNDLGGNALEKGTYFYEFFAKGFDGSEFPKAGKITLE